MQLTYTLRQLLYDTHAHSAVTEGTKLVPPRPASRGPLQSLCWSAQRSPARCTKSCAVAPFLCVSLSHWQPLTSSSSQCHCKQNIGLCMNHVNDICWHNCVWLANSGTTLCLLSLVAYANVIVCANVPVWHIFPLNEGGSGGAGVCSLRLSTVLCDTHAWSSYIC